MTSLDQIALANGTDKSSRIHDYCQKYERYLGLDRMAPLRILEIGIHEGASLRMWRDYLPNAQIVGIDILAGCKANEDTKGRISVEIGSQTDARFLHAVAERHGPFDMILDDGSHHQSHVIASFKELWDSVKPGAIYVVEDACTSYWPEFGGGLKRQGSTIEFFKSLIDDVNFFGQMQDAIHPAHARRDDGLIRQFSEGGCLGTTMESIQFLNSIIVMRKRS